LTGSPLTNDRITAAGARTVARRYAFWFVAYAFTVAMLGTTLPTPLYPIYQERLGFSSLTVTLIFAVYAFAVIVGLLLCGRLSDEVGRRPMLLAAVVLSALSAAAFLGQGGLGPILMGRVLSGLSGGIVVGTATAALVELAPERRRGLGTSVAVAASLGGLGLGALIAGALAQFAPAPLRLPFAVDLVLLVPAALGVLIGPETVRLRHRARLRPQRVSVPPEIRAVFVRAATVGFCAFAVSGLYGAVAPTMLTSLLHLPSHLLAGGIVFLLFLCSAGGQFGVARLREGLALPLGCAGLAVGVGLLAWAIASASLGLLIFSAVLVGLGQGAAIGGGLRSINARAPDARRGEAASAFFVVIYVGLAVPVIGFGLAASEFGLRATGIAFSAIVAVVLVAVMASLPRAGRPQPERQAGTR
jgi:MFS family permease